MNENNRLVEIARMNNGNDAETPGQNGCDDNGWHDNAIHTAATNRKWGHETEWTEQPNEPISTFFYVKTEGLMH
jgi:hypothetical protein